MSTPNRATRIIIRPEYSAVAAKAVNGPSRAVKAVIKDFAQAHATRVCEIGCGLLANTPHLLRAFPYLVVTDRRDQYDRIETKLKELSRKYPSFKTFLDDQEFAKRKMRLHGAIVINVIHILDNEDLRVQVLGSAHRNLVKDGRVFIDIPRNEYYYKKLVRTARSHNDGHIMDRGNFYTFYKNMDFQEVLGYAEEAGFKLERRIYIDHRITLVCRKA